MINRNRSGDEIREIESDGGKTTFKIEFKLMEENKAQPENKESVAEEAKEEE